MNDKKYKLVALFFIALLLFNFPILGIFSSTQRVAGIPLLYLYVFIVWLILIIFTIWIIGPNPRKRP